MQTFKVVFFLTLILSVNFNSFAAVTSKEYLQKVYQWYESGEYETAISELEKFDRLIPSSKKSAQIIGLIEYWKGLNYARMNEFDLAQTHLKNAIDKKYNAKDLYYEYGQVLYTQEKFHSARIAFKNSIKAKYKTAISLYYIAFISQELKDYKRAVRFYNMIEKLPEEEKKEVIQAARMQVGDIYLERVEKLPDTYKSVKKYVVPQYKKALDWDSASTLAQDIKRKIEAIERKYELALFKMRNGRPTTRPPYFLRLNYLYGSNDNVNSIDESTKDSLKDSQIASAYNTVGVFGRYTFYPSSTYSISPEVRANYTKYSSTESEILKNNNYAITTALKVNHEHSYNDAPATFYIDTEFTYNADDADADKTMALSSQVTSFSLNEELQLISGQSSNFRFQYSSTAPANDGEKYSTTSLTYEHLLYIGGTSIFGFIGQDRTRYASTTTQDTNILNSRFDFIFPTVWILFDPTIYLSYSKTSYINDSARDVANKTLYGFNLNRQVGPKMYLTFDFSIENQTAKADTDAYKKQIMSLNLDYIF